MFCTSCKQQIGFTDFQCKHCGILQYPLAWQIERRNLPNTRQSLELKAKDTAQRAIAIALYFIKNNEQKYNVLSREKERLEVAWFIICFFAHLTVRQIANKLQNRDMEQLFFQVVGNELTLWFYKVCGGMQGLEVNKKLDQLAEFDLRYRKYLWGTPKGKGLNGTVFWEFEKELSNFLGHPNDVAITMGLEIEFTQYFRDFDVRTLLQI